MFGLIGYAIDSDNVALGDHDEPVGAILDLDARGGPHPPRASEDYALPPAPPEASASEGSDFRDLCSQEFVASDGAAQSSEADER
ncbi:hypothetical protein [Streptomyces sp. NPDC127108]|uniref:hypothetical protein n=1 Tax=Streptomyces sp. NPDC127108 TaxID=3345361 RepID=UPI003634C748